MAKKKSKKSKKPKIKKLKSKKPKKVKNKKRVKNTLKKVEKKQETREEKATEKEQNPNSKPLFTLLSKVNFLKSKNNIIQASQLLAIILILALIFVLVLWDFQKPPENSKKIAINASDLQTSEIIPINNTNQKEELAIVEKIDSSNWATYTNKYYGFELKYPPEWDKVSTIRPARSSKWVQQYQFRKKNFDNQVFVGFNVNLYDVKNLKKISDTEEFPSFLEGVDLNSENCQSLEGHVEENPNYPAEEIYISEGDECFNPTIFYSLTGEDYMYDVVPVYAEDAEKTNNLRKQSIENFPEFFKSATSFKLIDIVRSKPKPAAPKITAPKPYAGKKVNGRIVCDHKNDKPSYSNKKSKKHMDMECCLDPDEYPNPWCYYDQNKYGKYLK